MDKAIFEKSFIEKLDKNFTKHSEFFTFKLKVFSEFYLSAGVSPAETFAFE